MTVTPCRILAFLALCAVHASCVVEIPADRIPHAGPAPAPSGARGEARRDPFPGDGPVELTAASAILAALEANSEFAVRRFGPAITAANEDIAKAEFDPVVAGGAETGGSSSEGSSGSPGVVRASSWSGSASLDVPLSTGTSFRLEYGVGLDDSTAYSGQSVSNRAGVSVTQSLLQGFGPDVNLASLRQARLDSRISGYEFRGLAEALAAEVEKAYWNYVLAMRQLDIYAASLELAGQSLTDVEERIRIGKIADVEVYAAQAEVALRREDLINAKSALAKARVHLVRLINLRGKDPWKRSIGVPEGPLSAGAKPDAVEKHLESASKMRPDLNQARLSIRRNELEVVKTRNGMLPRLDLFISLGTTGYSKTFGESLQDMFGSSYEASAGVSFSWPAGSRAAAARDAQAGLRLDQARAALENMQSLVEEDVRTAHIEAERAAEQIPATAATRRLKEQALRAETEKFRVGKSTTFLVAQARHELISSQIAEVQAGINHLKALVDLYRLDGSLLVRRGISAPGIEPVTAP